MEHTENERIEQRNIIFTKKDKLWKDKIGKAADEIKKMISMKQTTNWKNNKNSQKLFEKETIKQNGRQTKADESFGKRERRMVKLFENSFNNIFFYSST